MKTILAIAVLIGLMACVCAKPADPQLTKDQKKEVLKYLLSSDNDFFATKEDVQDDDNMPSYALINQANDDGDVAMTQFWRHVARYFFGKK